MEEIKIKYIIDEFGNNIIQVFINDELEKEFNYEYLSIEAFEKFENIKQFVLS